MIHGFDHGHGKHWISFEFSNLEKMITFSEEKNWLKYHILGILLIEIYQQICKKICPKKCRKTFQKSCQKMSKNLYKKSEALFRFN